MKIVEATVVGALQGVLVVVVVVLVVVMVVETKNGKGSNMRRSSLIENEELVQKEENGRR